MKYAVSMMVLVAAGSVLAQGAPTVNENTGDLTYAYGFDLPKSRGRYQPKLALTYSSANNQDVGFGHGWTLASVYIEWDTRGSPDKPTLWLVNGGERKLLVSSSGKYRAEIEESFLEVTDSSANGLPSFTAVDANGTTYTFTRTATTIDGVACRSRVYLSQVVDLDGNIVQIVFAEQLQPIPGVWSPNAIEIRYNNFGSGPDFAHKATVKFDLAEGSPSPREMGGCIASYLGRLVEVNAYSLDEGTSGASATYSLTRQYRIGYASGGPAGTTSIDTITEIEPHLRTTALPPTSFSYDWNSYSLDAPIAFDGPGPAPDYGPRWLDLDGDGRADLVQFVAGDRLAAPASVPRVEWARNITPFGGTSPTFAAVQSLLAPAVYDRLTPSLIDFDGDGLVDLVWPWSNAGAITHSVVRGVKLSDGTFTFSSVRLDVTGLNGWAPNPTQTNALGQVADINGDGVPDYAAFQYFDAGRACAPNGPCAFQYALTKFDRAVGGYVVPQTGTSNLAPGKQWYAASSDQYNLWLTFDMNGDGLADPVWIPGSRRILSYFPVLTGVSGEWHVAFGVGGAPANLVGYVYGSSSQLAGYSDPFDFLSPVVEGPPCSSTTFNNPQLIIGDLLDFNGDGKPDYYANGAITWNNGAGFGTTTSIVNGPQFARYRFSPAPGNEYTIISGSGSSQVETSCTLVGASDPKKGEFVDLNGDGIPDFVWTTSVESASPASYQYFRGRSPNGIARPAVLRAVRTSEGAEYSIEYLPSTYFGAPARARKPVVTAVKTLNGAFVAETATYYWYGEFWVPSAGYGGVWYDPVKNDDRGFLDTWTQDTASKVVRHTTWRGENHALGGKPSTIWSGYSRDGSASVSRPDAPPASVNWFARQSFDYGVKSLSAGAGTACLASGESSGASYPVRVVPTQSLNGQEFGTAAEATVAITISCSDVDEYGNVLKSITTPTLQGTAGASLVTMQDFVGTTSCKNIPARLTTSRSDGARKLTEEVKKYDSACRLIEQYSPGSSTPLTMWTVYSYNGPFRLLDATATGGLVKRFAYDSRALNIVSETQEDATGANVLKTSYTYDSATGLRLSAVGPVSAVRNGVSQAPTASVIARYYLYDTYGRKLAVAKQPFTIAVSAGTATIPAGVTAANSAVESYVYVDSSLPHATISYRYPVAKNYAIAAGAPALQMVPESDDVAKSVAYRDGLGRTLQVRERLGGGVAPDAGARVTQRLTGWRVAKAVIYDGAGRERVSLDPFYDLGTAGGGRDASRFVDYSRGGIPPTRATVTTYDDEAPASYAQQRYGHVWCSSYQYVEGALPAPASDCSSNYADDATFRLATETATVLTSGSYSPSVSQRGPYYGLFIATEVVPPEANGPGGSRAKRVTLTGPGGEQIGLIDGDGNFTWIDRDALGREVASWREAADRSVATPRPVSTTSYTLAGQIHDTWDANYPGVRRVNTYDEAGRLVYVTTDPATGEGIRYVYETADLGRVTRVEQITFPGGTQTVTLMARNHYDVAYNNELPEFMYTAGRLAWTENTNAGDADRALRGTTIAYGYDDASRVARRDQVFSKLDDTKRFSVSSVYGTDGRVVESRVVNPFDANAEFIYCVDYDSAGHPITLSGKLGKHSSLSCADSSAFERIYSTAPQGMSPSYDSLGRVPVMTADGGRVVSARSYSQYGGQVLGECKRFDQSLQCAGQLDPAKDIYRTDPEGAYRGAVYEGSKLKAYTDRGTQTSYQNAYWPSGRLLEARATATGAISGLTQDWIERYGFNGIGNLDQAVTQRNLASVTSRPRRYMTEAYWPVLPASGQAIDRIFRILHTARTLVAQDLPGGPVAETPTGSQTFSYDLLNHLTRVTRSSGTNEELYYAPGGEILYRRVNEQFFFYVGDFATVAVRAPVGCGNACVPQIATVEVDTHVVFAGTRIASVKPSRTLYYYRTRLGSVIATSLGGGIPGASYRYTPYGQVDSVVNETDATRSELGFGNALRLSESLLYLRNRVYSTDARHFMQADSIERARYQYVLGDPVNASDPSGMATNAANETPSTRFYFVRTGSDVSVVKTGPEGLSVIASLNLEVPVTAESAKQFANAIALAVDGEQASPSALSGADGAGVGSVGAGEWTHASATADGATVSIVKLSVAQLSLSVSIERRTGAHPFRDNNPGDISIAGRFAMAHGAIGRDGGFAIFADADAGFRALHALLASPSYRGLTVDGAVQRWAPPLENDTAQYQAQVRGAMGVSGDTRMAALSPEQVDAMGRSIAQMEGFNRPGVVKTQLISLPVLP